MLCVFCCMSDISCMFEGHNMISWAKGGWGMPFDIFLGTAYLLTLEREKSRFISVKRGEGNLKT